MLHGLTHKTSLLVMSNFEPDISPCYGCLQETIGLMFKNLT